MFILIKKILVCILLMFTSSLNNSVVSDSDNTFISNDKCSNNLNIEIQSAVELFTNTHNSDSIKINTSKNSRDTISKVWYIIEIGKPVNIY